MATRFILYHLLIFAISFDPPRGHERDDEELVGLASPRMAHCGMTKARERPWKTAMETERVNASRLPNGGPNCGTRLEAKPA
jgi:hypothetical protein